MEGRRLDYLVHMLDVIGGARRYIEGYDKHDFQNDTKTQHSVILKLLVIGEAGGKIASGNWGQALTCNISTRLAGRSDEGLASGLLKMSHVKT